MQVSPDLLNNFHHPESDSKNSSYFFSFEGIEGAGKSLQIKKLQEALKNKGFKVKIYREPGSTTFGEGLREAILLSNDPLHPMAEALLFASARTQLLHQIILKDLQEKNTIVICDRYIDSSLAYQGMARGLGFETVLDLHKREPLNLLPHRTFYLKISIDCSQERQKKRNQGKDYFEKEDLDFYQKLIDGYDLAAKCFPNRVAIINGEEDVEQVSEKVLQSALELIQ